MSVNTNHLFISSFWKNIKYYMNSRVVRFLFVGFLNTLFGYSLYAILVFSGIPYFYSLLVTTIVGVVFNFFSMGRMVFKGNGGHITFLKFIFVYLAVYLFNAYFLDILITEINFNPYISQAICLLPSIFFNWFMLKNWVFR
ncbi:GtrA family protein [Photobacterium alginatilyticum]|uniref:GtrA family protein n=2 Tax=Photobacterium alginatilyticum TaxID=1775171 RepID=A0ABW9YCW6_9GAMM|nr:GtrA family protein [Photobacterium alginatilyticum]